jgi:hypothetical protein
MEALDGNAIGGLLRDVFGTEMTAAATECALCGAAGILAGRALCGQQRAHAPRVRVTVARHTPCG